MIPQRALLIPLFLSFQSLGLLNSYSGLILAYVASVLPFSIWVMRGFFVAVPIEIEEAAKTDGAGTVPHPVERALPARHARGHRHERVRVHRRVERLPRPRT